MSVKTVALKCLRSGRPKRQSSAFRRMALAHTRWLYRHPKTWCFTGCFGAMAWSFNAWHAVDCKWWWTFGLSIVCIVINCLVIWAASDAAWLNPGGFKWPE